jgi:hypothetical protein
MEFRKTKHAYLHGCLLLFLLLGLTACGGSGGSGGSSESAGIQGKLAQVYVKGALVWADKVEANGLGNFARDAGETDSNSDNSGGYSLDVTYTDYVLVTTGGTVTNSSGEEVPAAPMLAPAVSSGQGTTNITPLTTLVTMDPTLKAKLSNLGDWNADIASSSGVNAGLLRIAKTTESLWQVLGSGTTPLASTIEKQLKSLGKFANSLSTQSGSLATETALQAASSGALDIILSDVSLVRTLSESEKSSIKSAMNNAVAGIVSVLPETGTVVEGQQLAALESGQANALDSIDSILGNATTITLGGGVNFDPIIRKIEMALDNTTLTLTVEADDDSALEQLSYLWTTSSDYSINDANSSTASVSNYSLAAGITVTVKVTDPGQLYDRQSCSLPIGATTNTCPFIEGN